MNTPSTIDAASNAPACSQHNPPETGELPVDVAGRRSGSSKEADAVEAGAPAALLDALIVGGGPAGLSAGLILGRSRRRVLIVDAGRPRNAAALAMHGYLSRDGMAPSEFLQIGREQLTTYPNVEFRRGEAVDAARTKEGFIVHFEDGRSVRSRLLLLASGVVDEIPEIEGLTALYGKSVHQCPYCDGWEHRDQPIAVYGGGKGAAEFALELSAWSRDVVLCSNGPAELPSREAERLLRRGVSVIELPIDRLEGEDGQLSAIRFRNGESLERRALFFLPAQSPCSHLPKKLGCRFADDACLEVGDESEANVPGVFAAGNASVGLQMVIIAAAEGAKAAVMMNQLLIDRECT